MKNKTFYFIISTVLLLAVIKIVFLKPQNTDPISGAQPPQTAPASGFVVHPMGIQNTINSSGTVLANEEVELRPEAAGRLVSILFKEGTLVNKGALLVKINDAELQAQLKKLNLQYKLSKEKEGRLKELLNIKGISQEEYDAASNQLETIEADMDFTKAQLAKTEIRAPFTGKIGLKSVSEGSFVNSSTVIAVMQQTDVLKIDFSIPEKYASAAAVGDTVNFYVEGIRQKMTAKVAAIEPRITAQNRSMLIRAIYVNAKSNVYPGAFAKVELAASKKQISFMIPSESIIPDLKGNKVFICKNGKALPVRVEIGTRTNSMIDITAGLAAGDTVITTGMMSLKPDMNVKIVSLKK